MVQKVASSQFMTKYRLFLNIDHGCSLLNLTPLANLLLKNPPSNHHIRQQRQRQQQRQPQQQRQQQPTRQEKCF